AAGAGDDGNPWCTHLVVSGRGFYREVIPRRLSAGLPALGSARGVGAVRPTASPRAPPWYRDIRPVAISWGWAALPPPLPCSLPCCALLVRPRTSACQLARSSGACASSSPPTFRTR